MLGFQCKYWMHILYRKMIVGILTGRNTYLSLSIAGRLMGEKVNIQSITNLCKNPSHLSIPYF